MTIVYPCGCVEVDTQPDKPGINPRFKKKDIFCQAYGLKTKKDITVKKVNGKEKVLKRYACERLNQNESFDDGPDDDQ